KRGHLAQQRHLFPAAACIDCAPIHSALLHRPHHRQDGCHADSADDEEHVTLVAAEIERVARALEHHWDADPKRIVHLDGTATTIGDAAHCNTVVGSPPGRSAQRILTTATG